MLSWGVMSCHMDGSYYLGWQNHTQRLPETIWSGKVASLNPALQESPQDARNIGVAGGVFQ